VNGPRSDTVTVWTTLVASSASVARQSLTAFATWSTALVVCLATPVLSVVFLTAMSSSAGGEAGAAVAYRCAVMVAVTTASALMVDLGMTDRRLGVIDSPVLGRAGLVSPVARQGSSHLGRRHGGRHDDIGRRRSRDPRAP